MQLLLRKLLNARGSGMTEAASTDGKLEEVKEEGEPEVSSA